jgi:acylphosphatase
MADERVARRLLITGRVQGVGFRAFVKQKADKLALDGFVRNRKDGSVEAVVIGNPKKVETLIALCHEGPPTSRVTDVKVNEGEVTTEKGFVHLPTF